MPEQFEQVRVDYGEVTLAARHAPYQFNHPDSGNFLPRKRWQLRAGHSERTHIRRSAEYLNASTQEIGKSFRLAGTAPVYHEGLYAEVFRTEIHCLPARFGGRQACRAQMGLAEPHVRQDLGETVDFVDA